MGNNTINYEDERLAEVEAEKQQTLTETENAYQSAIDGTTEFYQEQKNALNDWADKQTELQNEQTNFAIEQIEQQKEQAEKDYQKEQRAAYVDYQKMSNDYSVGAEERAASGLSRSGYSESSQVALYTAYQNRVAVAREALQKTFQNFDNQMAEARLQNNVALAQIAHDNLMTQIELDLQGFQYGNQLLIDKINNKLNINTAYHSIEQNIISQINQENALAEQIRQFNEQMAEEKRQANANYALNKAQLAEEKRQFDEQMAYTKSKSSGSGSGSSGSGDGGYIYVAPKQTEEGKPVIAPKVEQLKQAQKAKQTTNQETVQIPKAMLQQIGMNRTVDGRVNAIQRLHEQGSISDAQAKQLLEYYTK